MLKTVSNLISVYNAQPNVLVIYIYIMAMLVADAVTNSTQVKRNMDR